MKKYILAIATTLLLTFCKRDTSTMIPSCHVYGHVKDKATGLPVDTFPVQICKLRQTSVSVIAKPLTGVNGNYSAVLPFNNDFNMTDKISIVYSGPLLGVITGGNGMTSQVKESIEYDIEFLCISKYTMLFRSTGQVADSITYFISNSFYPTANTKLIPNPSYYFTLGNMYMAANCKNYLHYSAFKSGLQTNYVDSITPTCGTMITDTLYYN